MCMLEIAEDESNLYIVCCGLMHAYMAFILFIVHDFALMYYSLFGYWKDYTALSDVQAAERARYRDRFEDYEDVVKGVRSNTIRFRPTSPEPWLDFRRFMIIIPLGVTGLGLLTYFWGIMTLFKPAEAAKYTKLYKFRCIALAAFSLAWVIFRFNVEIKIAEITIWLFIFLFFIVGTLISRCSQNYQEQCYTGYDSAEPDLLDDYYKNKIKRMGVLAKSFHKFCGKFGGKKKGKEKAKSKGKEKKKGKGKGKGKEKDVEKGDGEQSNMKSVMAPSQNVSVAAPSQNQSVVASQVSTTSAAK